MKKILSEKAIGFQFFSEGKKSINLRVLHINSSDIYGGAAEILSLHNSLMNENIQSYILTNNKNTEIKNDISKSFFKEYNRYF